MEIKAKSKKRTRGLINPEQFIRDWQSSETMAEVIKKTGKKKEASQMMYYRFLRLGVKLKPLSNYLMSKDKNSLRHYKNIAVEALK